MNYSIEEEYKRGEEMSLLEDNRDHSSGGGGTQTINPEDQIKIHLQVASWYQSNPSIKGYFLKAFKLLEVISLSENQAYDCANSIARSYIQCFPHQYIGMARIRFFINACLAMEENEKNCEGTSSTSAGIIAISTRPSLDHKVISKSSSPSRLLVVPHYMHTTRGMMT
jgi:hypothetical protein